MVFEVLGWLGWDDEEAAEAVAVLDDTAYVLTDKGRAILDAPRPVERARYDDEAARQAAFREAREQAHKAGPADAAAIRRTVEEQAGTRREPRGSDLIEEARDRREATLVSW